MPGFVLRLVKWVIAMALIATLARALWAGYALLSAGESLSAVPIASLALDVMRLHVAAGLGAAAGLVLGLLAQGLRLLGLAVRRRWRRDDAPARDDRSPDAIIRAERARVANAWLEEHDKRSLDYVAIDGEDPPTVENVVTALEGRYTYRVMAYRHLTNKERRLIVRDAIERGLLKEPPPGGTATLFTSIGQ